MGSDCISSRSLLIFLLLNFMLFKQHHNLRPDPLGQSGAPSDWYSGGHEFDPRVRHHLS